MRKKTYFSPEQQWDKTVDFLLEDYQHSSAFGEVGVKCWPAIGQIVLPTRLFLPGDIVFITKTNGMGERVGVTGVSSKNYRVRDFYLNHHETAGNRIYGGKFYGVRVSNRLEGPRFCVYTRIVKRKCRRTLQEGCISNGPLRWIELPGHLLQFEVTDPPIRQHIVALAREGRRMPGKREYPGS